MRNPFPILGGQTKLPTAIAAGILAAAFAAAAEPEPEGRGTPPREAIMDEIARTVRSVGRELKMGVDPQIAAELAADAGYFVGNFCDYQDPGEPNPCEKTINDPVVLSEVIKAHLLDASRHIPVIETMASRLARKAGHTMADVGWPTTRPNNAGVITVPKTFEQCKLALLRAAGRNNIGGPAKTILMNPGHHTIVATFTDGRTVSLTADVLPLQKASWAVSKAAERASMGRIQASLGNYCSPATAPVMSPPLYDFNSGRSLFGEPAATRKAQLMPAASQIALEVTINDETGTCKQQCIAGLGVAFAQAVAVWRSACQRCDQNALSVLRIGSAVWVDKRATGRLRRYARSDIARSELDLEKIQGSEAQTQFSTLTANSARYHMVGYEQVDKEIALREALCALDGAASRDWVAGARAFLCPGAPPAAMELRPVLVIKNGWTECGAAAIACAKPGGDIELAAGEYKYHIATQSGEVVLATPSAKGQYHARLVILHEVGHWFGVPHPESVGVAVVDIMAGVFAGNSECLSQQSLAMLNNGTDRRWPFRAKGNQGLLPLPVQNATPPNALGRSR